MPYEPQSAATAPPSREPIAVNRPPRWQFGLGHLFIVTAIVAVNLAAWILAIRDLDPPSRSTLSRSVAGGCFPAIVSGAAMFAISRRRAGRMLLTLRWDRTFAATLTGTIVLPILLVMAIRLIPAQPAPVFAMRIGLAFGITFGSVLTCWPVVANTIDLCDNGILISRLALLPWKRIKPGQLRMNFEGNLELGQRWRRITATVPPDLRDAVDALLKEKLGSGSA